jgi:hypothetical protein
VEDQLAADRVAMGLSRHSTPTSTTPADKPAAKPKKRLEKQ